MNRLLEKYLRLFPRNGEGGGSAGAGDGGGAGAAGADGAGGDGGGSGGDGGSAAAGAGAAGNGGQIYKPDGLADTMLGKTDHETIDKLNAAVKGYRDRDAARAVPDKPEGYFDLAGVEEKTFKLDDGFKGHFEFLKTDPGATAALAVFQKAGVDKGVVLNAMQAMMGGLSEAGLLEPMVDVAAERAQLLPETHKNASKDQQDAAINARMEQNLGFVDLMVRNRDLPKEAGEYAQLMLADNAKGHKFLEWMRGQIQGGDQGPGAHGSGGGGGDTRESLKAELAKPEMRRSHPQFDKAKYDDLNDRYKKLIGNGS